LSTNQWDVDDLLHNSGDRAATAQEEVVSLAGTLGISDPKLRADRVRYVSLVSIARNGDGVNDNRAMPIRP